MDIGTIITLIAIALVLYFASSSLRGNNTRKSKGVVMSTFRYKTNAKKYLDACNYVIDIYEDQMKPTSKDVIDELLQKKMQSSKEQVAAWDKTNKEYINMAYTLCANLTFDLLASGLYHLYRGMLDPNSCAPNLLLVYEGCMKYGVTMGMLTERDRQDQYNYLLERISQVG